MAHTDRSLAPLRRLALATASCLAPWFADAATPDAIAVSPSAIELVGVLGTGSAPQQLTIAATGGSVSVGIHRDAPWLRLIGNGTSDHSAPTSPAAST